VFTKVIVYFVIVRFCGVVLYTVKARGTGFVWMIVAVAQVTGHKDIYDLGTTLCKLKRPKGEICRKSTAIAMLFCGGATAVFLMGLSIKYHYAFSD